MVFRHTSHRTEAEFSIFAMQNGKNFQLIEVLMKKDMYGWHIKQGDYSPGDEYDKLYLRNRKIEKTKRSALWITAGVALSVAMYFILWAVARI